MAPLFILGESSAGYLLLKATDKKLLQSPDLPNLASDLESTRNAFKLKKFVKFDSAALAVSEAAAISDGRVTPMLSGLLDRLKDEKKASLVVADPKLATAISKLPQLSITPISDSSTMDVFRAIRGHLPALVPGLLPDEVKTMSLGLSHSLSRHKLKFSPDKVDTMIVQAINLLDDLDKELNQYAMRVKEWYGWHFPEMARIVADNIAYARIIGQVGMRTNTSSSDLSDILPEDIEKAVKAAAEVSMGTEITEEDLETIQSLARQVVDLSNYRILLSSYLSSRMQALAPNLTQLVGELVGARLVAHAGSVSNLARSAASTIQILGAEKALFRALKTKHDTPKYGLIFHASLVGQATGKNKGKIARMLASKAALGVRIDSMDTGTDADGKEVPEDERSAMGVNTRRHLEWKLGKLEGRPITGKVPELRGAVAPSGSKFEVKESRKYNVGTDGIAASSKDPSSKGKRLASSLEKMELDHVNGKNAVEDESEDDDDDEDAEAGADADSDEEVDSEIEEEKVQTQLAAESANGAITSKTQLSKKEKKALKKAIKDGGQAAVLEEKSLSEKRREHREEKKKRRAEKDIRRAEKREIKKKIRKEKDSKKRERSEAERKEAKKRKRDGEEIGEGSKKQKRALGE